MPWFEVHICNFLTSNLNRSLLYKVAALYPISFHGVSLNLGGVDPIDKAYLKLLVDVEQEKLNEQELELFIQQQTESSSRISDRPIRSSKIFFVAISFSLIFFASLLTFLILSVNSNLSDHTHLIAEEVV